MKWYVTQCKTNQHQHARSNLCSQGSDIFSPCMLVERVIRRKQVVRQERVFPGYIFIRLDLERSYWYALMNARGVEKLSSLTAFPAVYLMILSMLYFSNSTHKTHPSPSL